MSIRDLITDLIPHAPRHGLYVGTFIPADKLAAAIQDYAPGTSPNSVVALYDATLLGNARDGALFLEDRIIYENNDLQGAHTVLYRDIVGVRVKSRILGGRNLLLDVNRGRATIEETIDFSARPKAARYVQRFLSEMVTRDLNAPAEPLSRMDQIRRRLQELEKDGLLTSQEIDEMLALLQRERL